MDTGPKPRSIGIFDRFNGAARRALLLALREARRCQHDFLGTEHVLFGLLCDSSGEVSALLRALSAAPESVLNRVQDLLFDDETTVALERFPLSPAVRRAFENAGVEAQQRGHAVIGPGDLLVGLLLEGDSEAAGVLADFGVALPAVRRQLGLLPAADMPDHAVQREGRGGAIGVAAGDAEPSIAALEALVAKGVVPDKAEPPENPGAAAATAAVAHRADAIERQLRVTQLVLGGLLGACMGYLIDGAKYGALFALGGFAVAAMRSSLLGALIGFVGGVIVLPLAANHERDNGWEGNPILLAMLGAVLGSFLGDFWRRRPLGDGPAPPPIEPGK